MKHSRGSVTRGALGRQRGPALNPLSGFDNSKNWSEVIQGPEEGLFSPVFAASSQKLFSLRFPHRVMMMLCSPSTCFKGDKNERSAKETPLVLCDITMGLFSPLEAKLEALQGVCEDDIVNTGEAHRELNPKVPTLMIICRG